MLALASIYEQKNSSAAFKYYDEAGVTEPYALFKLGDFMEKGLTYEHQFRGKPQPGFALGYYQRAAKLSGVSIEAYNKLGEYYQKGIAVQKDIGAAIRRYEEAAVYGHILAMNALGSLYYNDMGDYEQATEWFKKAADKGCERSQNNLGTCYEFGHGVEKNRDMAY